MAAGGDDVHDHQQWLSDGSSTEHSFVPEAVESYGRSSYSEEYKVKGGTVERTSSKGRRFVTENVRRALKDAFLPLGYPDSVSKDYLAYQKWDTVQAFCSSITGTLATHAVLKGAGVGDSSATALAATITWMLKDGAGMIGRILFAWFQGSSLDCNAKQWRLMADLMNDAAIFLDLLAPFFLQFFLLIMCLSSITRAIVGVAGGATRAALTQHQALRDNMADVSAKDGSQETMVNFAALLVSLVLTPAVVDKQRVVWALFLLFTILHLFANWRAVRAVVMNRVNRNRFHLLVDMYLTGGGVRSPERINGRETLLPREQGFMVTVLGCSLSDVVKSKAQFEKEFEDCTTKQKKYILRLDSRARKVYLSLNSSSGDGDALKGLYHKEVLEYFIKCRRFPEVLLREKLEPNSGPLILRLAASCYNGLASKDDEEELVTLTGKLVENHFNLLLQEMERAGWDTEHCMLGQGEWRHSWRTLPQGAGP